MNLLIAKNTKQKPVIEVHTDSGLRQDSRGHTYNETEASKDLMRFNATSPEKRSTNSTCISHYPLAYFTAV